SWRGGPARPGSGGVWPDGLRGAAQERGGERLRARAIRRRLRGCFRPGTRRDVPADQQVQLLFAGGALIAEERFGLFGLGEGRLDLEQVGFEDHFAGDVILGEAGQLFVEGHGLANTAEAGIDLLERVVNGLYVAGDLLAVGTGLLPGER